MSQCFRAGVAGPPLSVLARRTKPDRSDAVRESDVRKHQRRSNVYVLLAIACYVGMFLIAGNEGAIAPAATMVLFVLNVVFFLLGCREYARSKGRHAAWGWLGLLGIIGLFVLVACLGKRARA